MGKRKRKKKQTASGGKQSVSQKELSYLRESSTEAVIRSLTKAVNEAAESISHALRE